MITEEDITVQQTLHLLGPGYYLYTQMTVSGDGHLHRCPKWKFYPGQGTLYHVASSISHEMQRAADIIVRSDGMVMKHRRRAVSGDTDRVLLERAIQAVTTGMTEAEGYL